MHLFPHHPALDELIVRSCTRHGRRTAPGPPWWRRLWHWVRGLWS